VKPSFQADEDLNEVIVKAVLRREPSVDFQTARAAGLSGLEEFAALALAARSGRLLATHDRRTMPGHFARFITTETSAGVMIVPQAMPIVDVVESLLLIWAASEAEEWKNRICVLPL